MRSIVVVSSAIVGVFLLSLPAVAQQKTVRACQAEWRANKDANQAKGITEKAYVTQCRAAAPTTTTMAPAAPPPAAGGQKTVRACQAEWRANKDANQARGITEKAYVAQCRTGGTVAAPAQAPAQAPAPAPTRTTAPAPSSVCTAAGHHSCSTGHDDTDGCEPIYDGRPGQNAMPDRHRRLGQYEFEDLSLHRLQGLRQHENGRVYVRD